MIMGMLWFIQDISHADYFDMHVYLFTVLSFHTENRKFDPSSLISKGQNALPRGKPVLVK